MIKFGQWLLFFVPSTIVSMVKGLLIKKWSREIAIKAEQHRQQRSVRTADKNLAGLGGSCFNPASIQWTELYAQCGDFNLHYWADRPNVIREHLFFAYFGPLEAWCDSNCQSQYYLWSDDRAIYRQFTDPADDLLWKMVWESYMPTMKEIELISKLG